MKRSQHRLSALAACDEVLWNGSTDAGRQQGTRWNGVQEQVQRDTVWTAGLQKKNVCLRTGSY
jgi:hypothetical protein